jgi:hypothetical protein
VSYDYYQLVGTYVAPPRSGAWNKPSISLACVKGVFKEGVFDLNAVADGGLNDTSLVELRVDGTLSKTRWERSSDGKGLFFKDPKRILFTASGKPSHSVMVGVNEVFGSEVVVKFDMPDLVELTKACKLPKVK